MRRNFYYILLTAVIFYSGNLQAQLYKQMMNDPNVNFYDVVKEADRYFENRDKGKGTGWAPYQRWKFANEGRFYPSGVRNQSSPFFAQESFSAIINESNVSNLRKSASSTSWKDLGPYRVEKISGHYAPGLGRVECFLCVSE
ncbi:MAG: hypothetical protein IPM69_00800 [Ignavibacteria bacterium]|nr:hypothetical protein [Ignavibacteria bacterium]